MRLARDCRKSARIATHGANRAPPRLRRQSGNSNQKQNWK